MPPESKDPGSPDAERDVILDTTALRVLAHPTRQRLLNRLREYGPSTARLLADEFDLDSGAASYHLRRLAAGGLIEEDEESGTRRDRWWRARHDRFSDMTLQLSPDLVNQLKRELADLISAYRGRGSDAAGRSVSVSVQLQIIPLP